MDFKEKVKKSGILSSMRICLEIFAINLKKIKNNT